MHRCFQQPLPVTIAVCVPAWFIFRKIILESGDLLCEVSEQHSLLKVSIAFLDLAVMVAVKKMFS